MNYLGLIPSVVVAFTLTGCGRKPGDAHGDNDHRQDVEEAVSFQAKHGLWVSSATAKFIGLRVADVEERKVKATFRFSAQVYRAANEARLSSAGGATGTALASGSISSVQAQSVREGQAVEVITEAATLPARIAGVKHDLEKTSGQVEVMLTVTDPSACLVRGAFVSVNVPLGSEKKVTSVPCSALLRTTEGDYVYTVSGERFVRAAIRLGVVNADYAEVADGLFEGDKIVVEPVMTLWLAELQSIRGGKACADGH